MTAVVSPLRKPETQVDRLIRYLRMNPGASSLEITVATSIVNVTGRVSDARKAGTEIDWLIEGPQQLAAFPD